jgi:hypothetical protein
MEEKQTVVTKDSTAKRGKVNDQKTTYGDTNKVDQTQPVCNAKGFWASHVIHDEDAVYYFKSCPAVRIVRSH